MTYCIIGIIILIILAASFSNKERSPVDELFGNSGEHLSIWNKGFVPVGGRAALTQEQSFRHLLITSSTGGGKTTGPIIGSVFNTTKSPSSLIILDPSSEVFKLTSGFLSKHRNRKIYCFDPTQLYDGFNPITLCKTITDLDKVAHILIKNAGVESKGDQFWATASELILSFFLQLVFFYGAEKEKNMAAVVVLLDTFIAEPQLIDIRVLATKDDRLIRLYKSINAIPERTRQSVLATAIAATKLFRSPDLERCTSTNTFDIADFRKEPSVLFLCIPLHMMDFMAPLLAVLFEMLFQKSLERVPEKNELPLYYIIDEMLTMRLSLPLVFSNGRKYRIAIMGVLQSMEMLSMRYSVGESFAIKSNACCLVYLPGQTIQTCRELQEVIGKCTIKDDNGRERQVYGMESSQIRTSKEAIVLINTSLPLRLPVIPFFNHFLYNGRTKIPPYVPEQKIGLTGNEPQPHN